MEGQVQVPNRRREEKKTVEKYKLFLRINAVFLVAENEIYKTLVFRLNGGKGEDKQISWFCS